MSHTYKNKGNGSFKHHYQAYLSHKAEPIEANLHDGASAEIDAGLLRSSFFEKRRFRRTAERLRRYTA
jgi:hypothetical protein